MSQDAPLDVDRRFPPFDRFGALQRLAAVRSGHASGLHARHQLYFGRDNHTRANMLIKVTSKPGVVYEQNLANEIASLTTINHQLPHSRYFPVLDDHGRLRDGRIYLTMSLFDEWPLATTIGGSGDPIGRSRTSEPPSRSPRRWPSCMACEIGTSISIP